MKLLFLFLSLSAHGFERRCLDSGTELTWSQAHIHDQPTVQKFRDVSFETEPLKPGDCVLSSEEKAIVFLRASDGAKHFGRIDPAVLNKLTPKKHQELSTASLLKYRGRHNDLTILFVICPADRVASCALTIRHRGKWVKDKKGKVLDFAVRARGQHRRRSEAGGDTPQGIYHFWATMFEDERGFGGIPRIDLDATLPPLNSFPYEMNRYALEEIIPASAFQDYWVNEWPLAYRLGRVHLRIHGSEDPQRPTEGCINTGAHTKEVLATLASIGVLTKDQTQAKPPDDPKTLGWKVAPGLGKTFVVVKDLD